MQRLQPASKYSLFFLLISLYRHVFRRFLLRVSYAFVRMTKKFYAAIENPPAATATYLLFRRGDSVKARRWETLGELLRYCVSQNLALRTREKRQA